MRVNKDILTGPEAAKHCAVNRVTMWRWIKSGNLKAWVTPGGHHRIRIEDLESFLRKKGKYHLLQKPFQKKSILIVDDDPLIQKAFTKSLRIHGYETEVAMDGFDAGIKVMRLKPDLIILDLIMPGMDGFEVCNHVKSNPLISYIKILVLTGYDTIENREEIIKTGADAYLVKPVDESVLLRHIKGLLNTHKTHRLKNRTGKQRK